MVAKRYKWAEGATLEDHSRRKHKILREYFYQYLIVRCQIPKQTKFRLERFSSALNREGFPSARFCDSDSIVGEGGRHGWLTLYRWICVHVFWQRLIQVRLRRFAHHFHRRTQECRQRRQSGPSGSGSWGDRDRMPPPPER